MSMYTNYRILNNIQHNIIVNQEEKDTKKIFETKLKNQLNSNLIFKINNKLNSVLYKHFMLWNYKTLKININEYLITLGNILYMDNLFNEFIVKYCVDF